MVADRPLLQLDLDAGPDEVSQPAISSDGMRVVLVSISPNGCLRFRPIPFRSHNRFTAMCLR
jgi:hypothetical protein